MKTCICCNRQLPENKDYFFMQKGKLKGRCKECCGKKFTNNLSHIPKDGYMFCKKCNRELPHTFQYFPEDKGCKSGLRHTCRECNKYYGRFLSDDEIPHRTWTEEEIELLKSVYKNYTNLEIIENNFFPGRTIRAIESQANMYGCNYKTEETLKRSNEHKSTVLTRMFLGRDLGQEWRDKISATKKEYYKTHDSWWKGKKRSEEQCRAISESKKGVWTGDKNPRHKNPLNGELNGRWKGGILNTYVELRSDTKEWSDKSSKFCNYKCVVTGANFDNVHHTTAFRDIVDLSFKVSDIEVKPKVCDYSTEEFELLRKALKDFHDYFGLGACLNKNVHKLFHDNYGYINFSPYDFLDFVYRIDIGEFDDWFANNNLNININYEYISYLENTLLFQKSA